MRKESFSKVYLHFRKPIFRYVSRLVHDAQVAEELTQEVFLKAFRFRESYQPKYSFSTWLWTIARNTVFDWRRKSNRDACPDSKPTTESEFLVEEFPSSQEDAEALMISEGDRQGVLNLFSSLTELQRKVLLLRLVHHLSYREISKKLGLSLSAVKCLAYRARMTLIGQFGSGTTLDPILV